MYGPSNAQYFDQAARNVACMAEVIARKNTSPSSLSRLDFIVLAPELSIENHKFQMQMKHDAIYSKVKRKVSEYEGELDTWFENYFEPTINCIQVHCLSWEDAIYWIGSEKSDEANDLTDFYNRCLKFQLISIPINPSYGIKYKA